MSLLGKGFTYHTTIRRADGTLEQASDHNLLPTEAVDFVAGLLRGTEQPVTNWYIGLFEGNYVPDAAVTAATLAALATECISYSETTRPGWSISYAGGVLDSLNAKASFTFPAAKRVYGAFLVSTSTKGGVGGKLLSIARFDTPKDIGAGEAFDVAASLTLIPTAL